MKVLNYIYIYIFFFKNNIHTSKWLLVGCGLVFSRVSLLDRKTSFFYCEKLTFQSKVRVVTYFNLFFKGKKIRKKPSMIFYLRKGQVCKPKMDLGVRLLIRKVW